MLFPSVVFLFCFFPIVLLLYYVVLRNSRGFKNCLLFFASIIFYAYGEKWGVLLLLGSIFVSYGCGLLLDRCKQRNDKGTWVVMIAAAFNLGLLVAYKYLDFLLVNINQACGMNIPLTNLTMPIGISFFVFQALSYVIDVYREKVIAQRNLLYLGLYISFFPQLVAGPIVRYETVAQQMEDRIENMDRFSKGVSRFIHGLGKKVLLADGVAIFADRIFGQVQGGEPVSVMLAWFGAICYTMQIYYDFSGYSDMAIGLGKCFGFEFEENFNYPYMAKSVTEFWRRWHISLSSWFRDYVYIPLGGNRVNRRRMYFNLLVVWLLTGIWHGAGWNFLVWGLMYFAFLALEKMVGIGKNKKIPGLIAHLYTMVIVICGWVIFKSPNLSSAIIYLRNMWGLDAKCLVDDVVFFFLQDNWLLFGCGFVGCTTMGKCLEKVSVIKSIFLALVFVLSLIAILRGGYSPFIYFSF